MKTGRNRNSAAVIAAVLLVPACLFAIDFGADITIYDGVGSGSHWWGGPQEDQEVEPGTDFGQRFDMEAFIWDAPVQSLTMVSGYSHWNPPLPNMAPGDVFIDVTGDVVYGTGGGGYGENAVPSIWGYDYVFDLDFENNAYTLYQIDGDSLVLNVELEANQAANPWRYDSGGTPLDSGSFLYWDDLTSADLTDYGLTGYGGIDGHYAVQLDLSPLPLGPGSAFTAHYVMECGNDNLMGRAQVPDGGSTVMLLGVTLCGILLLRRRRES